jgi:hypothetical protein
MRHAIELWPGSRYHQRAWLRSVQMLGDKWLLAKKIERRT